MAERLLIEKRPCGGEFPGHGRFIHGQKELPFHGLVPVTQAGQWPSG